MSSCGRLIGVVLTLASLVSAGVVAQVTALHVSLEHRSEASSSPDTHEHGASEIPHEHVRSVVGHWTDAHRDLHELSHEEAPVHEHTQTESADVMTRSSGPSIPLVSSVPVRIGSGDDTLAAPTPTSGTSVEPPAPRAAPLSRRTVVLQV